MLRRHCIALLALTAGLMTTTGIVQAQDMSKYPDWAGQWRHADPGNQFDNSKGKGRLQQAPLTSEYQALFEAGEADQAAGGQGNDPTYTCIPDGMPRAMNVIFPMEIIIEPKTTYILIEYLSMNRRIYTDGREFPKEFERSFMGYSIGRWVDEDGDGRYDSLQVETRLLKGPRTFDASGIPMHKDNQTIVRERFYSDKGNSNVLHDEITTIDHALTRPWVVTKNYRKIPNPIYVEFVCAEGNEHVKLGEESYMISADGYLMPAKKGQKPPDMRYFNRPSK